ncbi:hypothetical protein BT96DRAFT_950601, partial [Gymnopus androsaceus JB14]
MRRLYSKGKKNSELRVAIKGFIPQELVANKVNWHYTNLGIISATILKLTSVPHYCAKVLAYTKHNPSKLIIDLEKIDENRNGATFTHISPPGITTTEGPGATCKSRIETLLLDSSTPTNSRLSVPPGPSTRLPLSSSDAISSTSVFPDSPAAKDAESRTNINSVSDKGFLEKASEKSVEQRYGPVMEVFKVEGSRESRLAIGWVQSSLVPSPTSTTFTLSTARKYVEQFSNGVTIISLYLNPVPNSNAPPIEHSIFQVMKEASLLFCLPENPFFLPKAPDCGWIFAQHFCNRLGPAYLQLKSVLDENDPAHAEVLNNIKRRSREETFTRESIEQVIHTHSELIRLLYVNFAMVHYPASDHATELMFRDVARGGIRIVMSRNKEMYLINQRMLFDENYNLASTQSLKNKDIPEGGAKGTILPSIGATPRLCFEKYVDLFIFTNYVIIGNRRPANPRKTPGIKETLVDLYEKPELLFFGPD